MADATKSLFQRLMERRAAIEGGDATAAKSGAAAAGARSATAPSPVTPPPNVTHTSGAANALTRLPDESDAAFRLRKIRAAKKAGEL